MNAEIWVYDGCFGIMSHARGTEVMACIKGDGPWIDVFERAFQDAKTETLKLACENAMKCTKRISIACRCAVCDGERRRCAALFQNEYGW